MMTPTCDELSMELVPEEAVEIDIVDVPFCMEVEADTEVEAEPTVQLEAEPEARLEAEAEPTASIEAEAEPTASIEVEAAPEAYIEPEAEPRPDSETDFEDEDVTNFYVIIYLPGRSPGREYQIISNEDVIEDSWTSLQKGAYIDIIESNRITRGEVVLVSDELEYCRQNYHQNVTAHREERSRRVKVKKTKRVKQPRKTKARKIDISSSSSSLNSCNSSSLDNESPSTTLTTVSSTTTIVNVKDQETQTEQELEYEELKKKYQSMCEEAERFKKMFKEVQANMNQSLNKFELFNKTRQIDDSEPSTSTSRSTPPPGSSSSDDDKENLGPIITLGSNGTTITRKQYNQINWKTKTQCIRDLMKHVFTRNEMATRSLTGRPSPAFVNTGKKVKSPLNQEKVEDIIEFIKKKTGMDEQNIRGGITTKCADENKMLKRRLQKQNKKRRD